MLNSSTAQLNCLFAITVRRTSDVQHCTRLDVRQTDQFKHWHETQLVKTCKLVWRSWDRASWYISIVKTTRCTIFRVYWISLYVFRTVFPSIFRSPGLYIQRQVYVIQVRWLLASGNEMEHSSISCPLANSQLTCVTYTWSYMYSPGLLMMDRKTVRNMESGIQ